MNDLPRSPVAFSVDVPADSGGAGRRARARPHWLSGLVGVVVFFVLGYGCVTLYCRRTQQLDRRNGLK